MVSKLLLGTGNQTKAEQYKQFLEGLNIQIVTTTQLKIVEPDESGKTLEQNAILKAKYYFSKSGLPSLADDAGFEILALNNFPGALSHRFEGHKMKDAEVIEKIIKKMEGLQGQQRKASMKVVVALAISENEVYSASGQISGHVPEMPYHKTMKYFPYRSLLFIDSLNKWFYDLTEQEEETIGYRKYALNELKKI